MPHFLTLGPHGPKSGSRRGGGSGVPPSGGEPVYNPATDTLLLDEPFDEYSSVTDMVNATGPHITPTVFVPTDGIGSLITGRTGTGKAYRIPYAGTAQEIWHCDAYADATNPLTADVTGSSVPKTLIIKDYRRVSAITSFGQFVDIPLKWMMAFMGDGSTRYQFNTHNHGNWPAVWPSGSLWQTIMGGYETNTNAMQPLAPFLENLWGTWWSETFAFRPNSSPSQKDGFASMWVNGSMIIDVRQDNVGVVPPGAAGEGTPDAVPWCWQGDVDALGLSNDGTQTYKNFTLFRWWANLTNDVPGGFNADLDDVQIFVRP